MLDYSIISLFNSITIIVILLWFITFIGSFFLFSKNLENRFDSYECGFKSFTNLKLNISIGNYIVILFIVLYDVELLFTIPFILFFDNSCLFNISNIYILLLSILLTFIVDVLEDVVKWNF